MFVLLDFMLCAYKHQLVLRVSSGFDGQWVFVFTYSFDIVSVSLQQRPLLSQELLRNCRRSESILSAYHSSCSSIIQLFRF